MDFSLAPVQLDLQDRTRRFVAEQVMTLESDPRQDSHGPGESLRCRREGGGVRHRDPKSSDPTTLYRGMAPTIPGLES
ncbi:hypothetical protein AB4Z46_07755 [Variovorax sp. M-6]|uniref:hypothetical protein n=1 Tax=Variovorax sp. M-6 TaxID=3233041 RepID=UPI003F9739B1